MIKWKKLVISIFVPLIVGAVAGIVTQKNVTSWYATLQKPSWNPPNWVFGPVWTFLYILMGIAFYLIWSHTTAPANKRSALTLWIIQLVFNFFWSFIFFGRHQIGLALIEIGCLWIVILLTIFAFARINKIAAWLLVPYISWVTFAGLLNYAIYQLNK